MKKDYMTRLERAARWRLPPQEAEDVIADYRDIVGNPPRSEEELRREVGDPEQVIALLVSAPRAYRVWQAVFIALSACILIPGICSIGFFPTLTRLCFAVDTWGWVPLMHLGPVLALLGAVGTLVYFRITGLDGNTLPGAIPILLAVLGVWIAAILVADGCWIANPSGFAEMWGLKRPTFFGVPYGPPDYQTYRSLDLLVTLAQYGGVVTALLGVFALVKARTVDRRWAAVYVLSAAAMLVSLETFALLCGQDRRPGGVFTLQWSSLAYYTAAALAGAVGTGVALR